MLVIRHSIIIILHHIVDRDLKFLNTLFLFHIELLKIQHAEVVHDIDDHLIEFEELLIEKISLIHGVLYDFLARVGLGDLVKEVFIGNLVAFGQNIHVRQSHLHHCRD